MQSFAEPGGKMAPQDSAASRLNILAICGSLRRDSFNRRLMNAAFKHRPEGVAAEESISIGEIPHLNDDIARVSLPEPVEALNRQIRAADAVIIATPEYNYGIPGVLKNTLDWLTCPEPHRNALRFKPVALMGASIGNFGTVRCQLALRQSLLFHEAYVMPKPEVYVFRAQERFSTDGDLVHQPTIDLLKEFWPAFVAYSVAARNNPAAGVAHPAPHRPS
jgi:chromate reductase, NAD(P)H dehydrogenase (quinone)